MSLVHHKSSASTLPEALDQAASTTHGMTFYDGRGQVSASASFAELRDMSRDLARRLLALDVVKGDKIAIVAETRLEFAALFFACQYAGLVPVPLTAIVNLGGRDNYVKQLAFLIRNCEARAVFASDEFVEFVNEAVSGTAIALPNFCPSYPSRRRATCRSSKPTTSPTCSTRPAVRGWRAAR